MDLIGRILKKIEEGMSYEEALELFGDEIIMTPFCSQQRHKYGDPNSIWKYNPRTGHMTTLAEYRAETDPFLMSKLPGF